MYMRFSAQFRNAAGHFVETGSSSRWIKVGSARRMSVQSGIDFAFAAPPPGGGYVFRGKVDFRWTARKGKKWKVVRQRDTHHPVRGRRASEDADPRGQVRGPLPHPALNRRGSLVITASTPSRSSLAISSASSTVHT